MRISNEQGNATIEFLGFLVALVLPSVIGITILGAVLSAQETGVSAAREAARVFVRAQTHSEAHSAAQESVERILGYKNLRTERPSEISCTETPCLTPGGNVTVTVYVHVDVLFTAKGLTVQARETMPVDELRAPRPG